jgi:SHS2 domain-containing protein
MSTKLGAVPSTDNETLQTSVAQVFNERGDGVIVRGAQATQSKDDRQPHLTGDDAKDLLEQWLARYRTEHKTRVMLHKTSSFTPEERNRSSPRV